ncbi:MSCRAMM family protein [Nocardioides bruguierae]|uniref:MSCRAMM family protein n=1 Tax=Nocardioides bruguierae TaxID=2945102 RepID=UPI0020222CAC|nr:carboxypeptidase regulatory-like domain-containing protein [Nocardioides bruguierae]MCL8027485.1 carboxypeptidase-like regulatory domain-containing protein [Nocardioides bruguierae]
MHAPDSCPDTGSGTRQHRVVATFASGLRPGLRSTLRAALLGGLVALVAAAGVTVAAGTPASAEETADRTTAGTVLALRLTSADGTPVTGSGTLRLYRWNALDGRFEALADTVPVSVASATSVVRRVALSRPGRYYAVLRSDDGLADAVSGSARPTGKRDAGVARVAAHTRTRLDVPLAAAAGRVTLSGRALDASGAPIAGLPVAVHEVDDVSRLSTTTTDESGCWRLRVRPDRDVTVSVNTPADAAGNPVGAAWDPTLLDLHSPASGVLRVGAVGLEAASTRMLTGRVVLPDGSPLAGADVVLQPAFGVPWGRFTWLTTHTDAEGRFSRQVPAGASYLVTVEDLPGDGQTETLVAWGAAVDAAENTAFRVDDADVDTGDLVAGGLESGARTLSGVVTGPDGPAAGVRLSLWQWRAGALRRPAGEVPATVTTDAEGRYTLAGLPDGWWALRVEVTARPRTWSWVGGQRPSSLDAAGTLSTVGTDAGADVQVAAPTRTAVRVRWVRGTRGRSVRVVARVRISALSDADAFSGRVRFLDRGVPVGTVEVGSQGVARVRLDHLSGGRHRFQARFLGSPGSLHSLSRQVAVRVD